MQLPKFEVWSALSGTDGPMERTKKSEKNLKVMLLKYKKSVEISLVSLRWDHVPEWNIVIYGNSADLGTIHGLRNNGCAFHKSF